MRNEMIDLIDGAEELDVMPGKHDTTYKKFLFDFDGDKYAGWIGFSYNNGIEDGPYELKRVRPVVRTVTDWVDF